MKNKKLKITYFIYMDKKKIATHTFSTEIPKNSKLLDRAVLALFYHIWATLLGILNKSSSSIQFGRLSIVATCGTLQSGIADMYGVFPRNAKEIKNLLEDNNAFNSLYRIIIDNLLSTTQVN